MRPHPSSELPGAELLTTRLDITLENRLSEIPAALDAVGAFLDRQQADGAVRFDVCVAVEELLSNIINYAYADEGRHRIDLSLSVDDGLMRCILSDDGRAFDPLSIPEPALDAPLEEREIGGLGIHFVRQLMETVEYRRIDRRNVLSLTRRLDGGAS